MVSMTNVLGAAIVVDGVLVVLWPDGSEDTFSPHEDEHLFNDYTFIVWDSPCARHLEVAALSLEDASCWVRDQLEAQRSTSKVTYVPRDAKPEPLSGRTRFVRTYGGMAPVAA